MPEVGHPIAEAPREKEVLVFLPWMKGVGKKNPTGWFKAILTTSRSFGASRNRYRWKVWLTPHNPGFLQGAQPALWAEIDPARGP
jgi:hypothetical protein